MIPLNVFSSLIVFCRKLGLPAEVVDWDDFPNIEELPAVDMVGPMGIGIEEVSSGVFAITFSVGISTMQDTGLFRHREAVSNVFDALRVGKQFPYYDAGSEEIAGWIKVVDGTSLAPAARTENRSFQFVQAQALLDPSAF